MLITQEDIQRVSNEETLLHFLQEKLNLPIPEGMTLAQIALPLPLPFLGLDNGIAEKIIDCQNFSGLSEDALGDRRPFLIRFRREQDYPEILRKVAESLSQINTIPTELLFICADENFQPLAFAYFNDSPTEDWHTEGLNIFIWKQGNTRINIGSKHEFPANYGGKSNWSAALLTKLLNTGTPLGQHRDMNIHIGIQLRYKDAFVIDEYTREQLINEDPNSADLIEQFPDKTEKWRWELRNLIYIPNSKQKRWNWSGKRDLSEAEQIFKESYPAISAHLNFYKDRLKKASNPVEFYWEFPSRAILPKLEHPKIIYRSNAFSMQAAYDSSYRFLTGATHFIPTEDLSLLAILNSKLFSWFAHKEYMFSDPKSKTPAAFSKKNMKEAPIAPRTEEQKRELSDLVQQILDAPDRLEVSSIERKIDELVYELYELTEAEIALIEKGNNP